MLPIRLWPFEVKVLPETSAPPPLFPATIVLRSVPLEVPPPAAMPTLVLLPMVQLVSTAVATLVDNDCTLIAAMQPAVPLLPLMVQFVSVVVP